ncbi:hypothetical protein D9756_004424 [Leucocoprinus leucothites]|uniref:Retrotransposon gag domain-containing protein n=1 Tax=Leucocoprinus leucothites TaxID=201217 RepID=A0A8H5G0B2_9AGAR|nr:hypothetical protein D9756_004424 [Leucoagaricus leucothites]
MSTTLTGNTARTRGISVQNHPFPSRRAPSTRGRGGAPSTPRFSGPPRNGREASRRTIHESEEDEPQPERDQVSVDHNEDNEEEEENNAQELEGNTQFFELEDLGQDDEHLDNDGADAGGGDGDGGPPNDDPDDEGDPEDEPDEPPHRHRCQNPDPEERFLNIMDCFATNLENRNHTPQPVVKMERIQAKEPDTFDGSKPQKLDEFLFQCRLYFNTNLSQFTTERVKVSFAMTFLKGPAQQHFQTVLQVEYNWDVISWFQDFQLFADELCKNFGALDRETEAAEELEHLRMGHNWTITKYNVEFSRLASILGWPDNVLVYRYYRGLPDCISDIISSSPTGKPSSLAAMRRLAMQIDNNYWSRVREKKHTGEKPGQSSTHPDTQNQQNQQNKNKGKNNNNNRQQNSSQQPNTPSNPPSNNPKPFQKSSNPSSSSQPSNPLARKLNKEGKLTAQERQRRIANGQCLYCGGNHMIRDCPRKNESGNTNNNSNSTSSSSNANKPKGRNTKADADSKDASQPSGSQSESSKK